jgi:small subunit ribosomal protein S20
LANHKSAEKRARQALKRRVRNRDVKSEVRTRIKTVRAAVGAGDVQAAREQLRLAERSLRKASSKGVLKKTTASRSVSRLARAVHALEPS